MAKKIKKALRKLRYLDKTQSTFFIVTMFIAAFCLFTGVTYSYFTLSENLGSATITIAKINYTLSSNTTGYNNGTISVPAGETTFLDLELKSENAMKTRYALKSNASSNVNVYYSENLRKNIEGIIGSKGSIINLRIVIENNGTSTENVTFTVEGGYLQNTITSNITTGYFEQDETIRYVLYDENFENATVKSTMPSKDQYSYYKSECSNGVTPSFDETNWSFNSNRGSNQTSCDVYFKKASTGLEKYYNILGSNGLNQYTTTKPDTNGLYEYQGSTCSNGATYTFDESTHEFNVTSSTPNTLCVANFKTNQELEDADRYIVTFDSNGGDRNYTKEVRIGGTYGELPEPRKEGYTLEGWYTEPNGAGTKIESSTAFTETMPKHLYANWIEGIRVILDPVITNSSGERYIAISEKIVRYGMPYGELPKYTDNYYLPNSGDKYQFKGWYTDPVNGVEVTAETTVTALAEHTLYAQWTIIAGCFLADTLVYTPNGYIKIQDITVGDQVYSYNELTGNIEISVVESTIEHEFSEKTTVTLEDKTTINTTWNHKFYNPITKKWTEIINFQVGDYVMNSIGKKIKISSINTEKINITVYNFTVSNNHNYFVTGSNVLVHNVNTSNWYY